MIVSVHQPQYLPWIGFFHKILKSDCFVFLDKVQYKKREYQNRNKIRTKDGWIWLTVPVISKGLDKQSINDVRIDNSINWQARHYKSLRSWYGKAKYYNEHISFLEDVYLNRSWDTLIDLNIFMIKYLLEKLDIKTPVYLESEIGTTKSSTERIIEICKKLNGDTYLSGTGGREYLEEGMFKEEKIDLIYQDFVHPQYNQCFSVNEDSFISHMAVIDLLFNEGLTSGKILRGV